MRRYLGAFIFALALGITAPVIAASTASAESTGSEMVANKTSSQKILVHLGRWTNDLHSAHMALRIGTNLLMHGATVTLFLDREGVRMAALTQPLDELTWAGATMQEDWDNFVAAGGKILVCPGCAKDAGLTDQSQLRAPAVLGTMDAIAAAILGARKIIDY